MGATCCTRPSTGLRTSLQVLDTLGEPVLSIADARDGCWVHRGLGRRCPGRRRIRRTIGVRSGLLIAFDRGAAASLESRLLPARSFDRQGVTGGGDERLGAPGGTRVARDIWSTTYADGGDRVRVARMVGEQPRLSWT